MATFTTDIDVCNSGLAAFGGGEITAFDESSDLAAICANRYPRIRNYLLSIHPWRFTSGKRQLNLSGEVTPENEWTNAHVLPTSNLSGPWAVFGNGSSKPVHDYEVYGNYIYSDYDTIIIDYSKQADEAFWPDWFVEFASVVVGAKLAVPVADKGSIAADLFVEAFGPPGMQGRGGMFAECRRLDAQLQVPRSLFSNGDPLTSARAG